MSANWETWLSLVRYLVLVTIYSFVLFRLDRKWGSTMPNFPQVFEKGLV
jgi:hypothetical protein